MEHGQEDDHPKVLLLRRLEQEVARVHPLRAADVALLVGRRPRDLVRDSERPAATQHLPADLRLQSHLRQVVALVSMAARHCASLAEALHWYRNAKLAGEGGRTPEDLTAQGRQSQACRSLVLHAANEDSCFSASC